MSDETMHGASAEAAPEDGRLPGERTIPPLMTTRSRFAYARPVAGLLVIGSVSLLALHALGDDGRDAAGQERRASFESSTPARDLTVPVRETPPLIVAEPEPAPAPEPEPAPTVIVRAPPPPPPPRLLRGGLSRANASTARGVSMASVASSAPSRLGETLSADDIASRVSFGGGGVGGSSRADSGSLGASLVPTRTDAVRATRLANPGYTIPIGTVIPCALRTEIISGTPGFLACVVTDDVYSSDLSRLLVPAGTLATGEYDTAVRPGSRRVAALWSRLLTPDNTTVDLASPAVGALGAAGIAGRTNTHFWTRFGGAIMLSLVDDLGAAAVASARNGSSAEIAIGAAGGASARVVEQALASTVNIPPTVSTDAGARVSIYVARDLDFSSVYGGDTR